ncbi:MAG: T9SS type A sorting domain-containing protein [Bacteroidales bacterium]|nr:T9SS type A sorting domain-containing protein [Bacteroidales bacterium]
MKHFVIMGLALMLAFSTLAQTTGLDTSLVQQYVEVQMTPAQLYAFSHDFSVDKVRRLDADHLLVRICLGRKEYARFLSLDIPYSVVPPTRATMAMATSYSQMVSSWNRYPTYSTYKAMLDTFQHQFPNLCKIDTILAATPGGRSLFAVHISNNLQDKGDKPSFFYSATMHGDEPVGYYLMLHLIHYMLNNYETDARVHRLVDSVDIWICPLENPDGTYYYSNNQLSSYYSTRYNYNEVDLNRSYPQFGHSTSGSYEPEIEAMMAFGTQHHFTMSANFHGGAEVCNYPWDTWTTNQRSHADTPWWLEVSRRFADTCHKYHSSYMTEESNGVTEGGDWYVITGSRQDYFNYFQSCREMTIEVSEGKVVSSNQLPNYWNWIKSSLLNYIEESLYGIRGVVTDSVTGLPIEAQVMISNHDKDNSQVSSHLPVGDYHRPIKAGTYNVTYSAPGYYSKTMTLTVGTHATLWQDVALVPVTYGVEDHDTSPFTISPNPATDYVVLSTPEGISVDLSVELYDLSGRLMKTVPMKGTSFRLDVSDLPAGVYMVKISDAKTVLHIGKVVKK